jgi:hypothetical protein
MVANPANEVNIFRKRSSAKVLTVKLTVWTILDRCEAIVQQSSTPCGDVQDFSRVDNRVGVELPGC